MGRDFRGAKICLRKTHKVMPVPLGILVPQHMLAMVALEGTKSEVAQDECSPIKDEI